MCFKCRRRRSSAGVVGGGGGGVVGQVGVLLMLHSDQSFQGTPVRLDSRTDTHPENRQTIK